MVLQKLRKDPVSLGFKVNLFALKSVYGAVSNDTKLVKMCRAIGSAQTENKCKMKVFHN